MRSRFVLASCIVSILIANWSWSQVIPPFGPVFPQDEVTTIRIYIHPDSLAQMIALSDNVHDYPAKFIFESSAINDTIDTIGFRLKGNTSLNAEKKSFKLAIDAFDNNQSWNGFSKLNLIAQQNDPSLMRNKICHDLFRHYDIPCERTAYTRLYINDELRGLYVTTEQMDETFARTYFDSQGDGNLFKCTYPADLDYISNNPNDYAYVTSWGAKPYDLKTNEWKSDYSDLAHFIQVLVNTPISQLECELPKVFNVDAYLRAAAIDVLIGNWDGYIFNKNNFYLYKDQLTGQFNYLPYDLDNTIGIDWLGINWSNRNIYNWDNNNEERPLFTRLMLVPSFRAAFSFYIEKICTEQFNVANISNQANNWMNLIQNDAIADPFRPLDFGFTPDDFLQSIDNAWGGHVNYSLTEYVEIRNTSALNQLNNYSTPAGRIAWLRNGILADQTLIEAYITESTGPISLRYSVDGTNYSNIPLTDEVGPNQVANDTIYSCIVNPLQGGSDKFYYQIQLSDGTLYPCEPQFIWTTPSAASLFINEAMPLNLTTISDENGNYADWLELYNATNAPINLDGKFVTDNILNWNKFPLPNAVIPAHGFALFWLDEDMGEGIYHANFRLAPGENIYLNTLEDGVPRTMDLLTNLPTQVDISLERTIDGGPELAYTSTPTPGFSNDDTYVVNNTSPQIHTFPNPANDIIHLSKKVDHAALIDQTGRKVIEVYNSDVINTSSVASGVYYLQLYPIIVKQTIQH